MRVRRGVAAWVVTLGLACGGGRSAGAQGAGAEAGFPDGQGTPLGREVAQILREPEVAQAHWGVAVTTMAGVPVYGLNEAKHFRPASTAKLFTTAAAMALLGPEHRFVTRVMGSLEAATGTVQGDLVLRGGGDPSFGTGDLPYRRGAEENAAAGGVASQADSLQGLAETLAAKGVRQVTGRVVGDDSLFAAAAVPDGWAEEDLLWGYGALPSALSVGDNELRVTVRPGVAAGGEGQPVAEVSVDELAPYLRVVNEVRVDASAGAKAAVDAEALAGKGAGSGRSVRLYGTLGPQSLPVHETLAVRDAAAYAAMGLQQMLGGRGVAMKGDAEALHRPAAAVPGSFLKDLRAPGCEASLWGEGTACSLPCAAAPETGTVLAEVLAEVRSEPLAEEVAFTLKTSANLHAELLLEHLGRLASCAGTTLAGARVLRAWLLHAGVPENDVVLYDGSGLSTKDLVTPRSEVQLLGYAAGQPWFAAWVQGLPVGGVDGTLVARFTEAPLKGHVLAKTGTLGESRGLAGYVDCASGKRLVFAILVDDHEPGSTADRAAMDRIVAAIARLN